jgi:phosphopantetheinyl transferase (holo-ACP synthase)
MALSGRSAVIAHAKGTSRILVSLTHDGEYAFAQVMLVGEVGAPRGEPR